MKLRATAPMRTAKIGYIASSAAMAALGVLFIVWPNGSATAMTRALGTLAAVFGCIKIIGYFSKDLYRLAFQFDLEFGAVLLAAGLIMIIRPSLTLGIISVAAGITALFDGLFKLRIAVDAKRFGIKAWWLIAALGVAAGIIGFVLALIPGKSVAVLSTLIGISLIADGALNLAVVLVTVKIVNNQYPDIIDPEYKETEEEER